MFQAPAGSSSAVRREESAVGREAVADPVVGVDQLLTRESGAELGPQATDVDVDRTIVAARRGAPDRGVELLAGEDALRIRPQGHEQLQLTDREAEWAAVDQGRVLLRAYLAP